MGKSGPHIVIIGGVACGPKAAARARRRDQNAKITIIERGQLVSYAGCGLTYLVGGSVPDVDGLRNTPYGKVRDEAYFADEKDITVRTRTLAEAIDRKARKVRVKDLVSGKSDQFGYDKLVLATGASPLMPPIPGLDLPRVFRMHVPDDAVRVRELLEAGSVNRAAIIGAGRVGMEAAEALFAHGVEVTIVELADSILPTMLDPEMAGFLLGQLPQKDLTILVGEQVHRLEAGRNDSVARVITNKRQIETDMVIVGVGVRPNVTLARDAGLQLGSTGAITVNEFLQTSDPDIYAGGDCVECLHRVSQQWVYAPLGSTANRHGRVIGDNVTGGQESFPGIVGTSILKALGVNVACTGLSEPQARGLADSVVTALVPGNDHAHYYPGSKNFLIKLIADARTGRLLGAQIVGPGDVSKRVDVLATAITFNATVRDAADLDLGYAPPFSTALDSVTQAANMVRNKLAGMADTLLPQQVHERLKGDGSFVLLDVRVPREVEQDKHDDPHVRCIPLDSLRRRVGELPKDADVACICQVGMRGYEACLALKASGFSKASYVEGGFRAWACTANPEG